MKEFDRGREVIYLRTDSAPTVIRGSWSDHTACTRPGVDAFAQECRNKHPVSDQRRSAVLVRVQRVHPVSIGFNHRYYFARPRMTIGCRRAQSCLLWSCLRFSDAVDEYKHLARLRGPE